MTNQRAGLWWSYDERTNQIAGLGCHCEGTNQRGGLWLCLFEETNRRVGLWRCHYKETDQKAGLFLHITSNKSPVFDDSTSSSNFSPFLSSPDQTADALFDYVGQSILGRTLLIHVVSYCSVSPLTIVSQTAWPSGHQQSCVFINRGTDLLNFLTCEKFGQWFTVSLPQTGNCKETSWSYTGMPPHLLSFPGNLSVLIVLFVFVF